MASASPGRILIRRYLLDLVDGGTGRVDTKEAVPYVLAQLSDEEKDDLLEEALARYIQDELRQIASERRHARTGYPTANGFLSDEKLNAGAADVIKRMIENIGGTIRVEVGQMTRPDLLASVAYRRKQVRGHERWIGFELELASRLPDDETAVAEAIPDPDLILIHQSFFPESYDNDD